MEIITGLDFTGKKSSISLGKFDGIHRGHRKLLDQIRQRKDLVPTVFTFEMSEKSPKIYTQKEKDRILEKMGIAREVIFPFSDETKHMAPETFIEEILVKRLDVKYICVGKDFHFGCNRAGDIHTLERYQEKFGYELVTVPKVKDREGIISSTWIRGLLDRGDIPKANELLGSPYFIIGEVCHGNALGRTIGMPTANLLLDPGKKMLPRGVYATKVKIDDTIYYGVTNIGSKPTVGQYAVGVETYIMDFDEMIYHKEIQVEFYKYLRTEHKFEDLDALIRQMNLDKERARNYLSHMDQKP